MSGWERCGFQWRTWPAFSNLRTLVFGPRHGQGIAHGSLYPALQRLARKGWISAEWDTSGNHRKGLLAAAAPLIVVVGLIGCGIPAPQASRINAARSLRDE